MKFDINGMQSNVLPLINKANKGIESIEAKINAITIPSKLKSKDKIQSLKSKVGSIKGKVLGSGARNGISGKIEAKIAKVQNAESSNKALLDSIGGIIYKSKSATKKYIKDKSDTINKNLGNSYTISTDNKNKKIGKAQISMGNTKKIDINKSNTIKNISNIINQNLGDDYKVNNNTKSNGKINLKAVKKMSKTIEESKAKFVDQGEVRVNKCKELTDHFLKKGVQYSTNQEGEIELISGNIKACLDHNSICCATYVALALYISGDLTEDFINKYEYNSTFTRENSQIAGIKNMLQDAGWEQVTWDEVQTGDVVLLEREHVAIYAGDGKVWDQNTCCGDKKYGNAYKPDWYPPLSEYEVWTPPDQQNDSTK